MASSIFAAAEKMKRDAARFKAKEEGRWVTTSQGSRLFISEDGAARTGPGGEFIQREAKFTVGKLTAEMRKKASAQVQDWEGESRRGAAEAVLKSSGSPVMFMYEGDELVGLSSLSWGLTSLGPIHDDESRTDITVMWLATKRGGTGVRAMAEICRIAGEEGKGVLLQATEEAEGFYHKIGMGMIDEDDMLFTFTPDESRAFARKHGKKSWADDVVKLEPKNGLYAKPRSRMASSISAAAEKMKRDAARFKAEQEGRWVTTRQGNRLFIGEDGEARTGPGGEAIDAAEEISVDDLPVVGKLQVISDDEVQALDDYKMIGWDVNEALRHYKSGKVEMDFGEDMKREVDLDALDAAFNKSVEELTESVVVYRGIGANMEMPRLFVDKGFVSTSTSRSVAEQYARRGGRVVAIELPKGMKVVRLKNRIEDMENEVLIARNTGYVQTGENSFEINTKYSGHAGGMAKSRHNAGKQKPARGNRMSWGSLDEVEFDNGHE